MTGETSGQSKSGFILLLGVLTLADVTATFESMMVFAALKVAIAEFGSAPDVGWLVTAYLLVAASSAAIASRLGDMYGRREMLIIVMLLATAGSILSAVSSDLGWIVAGRAIQGVSGAIMPLAMGILREHAREDQVSLGVGILLSAAGIAATLGLFIGGLLTDYWGWHHIFTLSAVMGVLSALAAFLWLAPSVVEKVVSVDWIGGVLLAPAIALILLGVGGSGSIPGGVALVCFVAGSVMLVFWFSYEWRHPDPLIDVRLLAGPALVPNLCVAFWAVSMLQLTQVQMIFLQQPVATGVGLGLSATMAAVVKLPAKGVTMFAAPLAGYLVGKTGPRMVVMTGFALGAIGWLILIFHNDNIWIVAAVMAAFCAMGVTVVFTGISSAVLLAAPANRASESMGVLTVFRGIFQALGAQLVMIMLGTDAGEQFPDRASYQMVFALIAGIATAGILVSMFLQVKPGTKAKASPGAVPSG